MGVKYFGLFTDSRNASGTYRSYRVKFDFTGYSGAATEVRMGAGAFTLEDTSTDDSVIGVKEQRAEFEITNSLGTINSSDFFTEDEKSIKVTVERITKSGETITVVSTVFVGYVTPKRSEDPYTDGAKTIRITASDGISYLKNEKFISDGGYVLTGVNTWLFVANAVFAKIGFQINLNTVGSLRVSGQTESGTFEPMAFSNINLERFTNSTYYEVLDVLAKQWNAQIFQSEGEWYIIRMFDLSDYVYYRKWDYLSNYLSGGLYDRIQTYQNGTAIQPLSGGSIGYEQSLKKFTGTLKLGDYRNKLLNADFGSISGSDLANWHEYPSTTISRVGTGTAIDPYKVKVAGSWSSLHAALKQDYDLGAAADAVNKKIKFSLSAECNDVAMVAYRVQLNIKLIGVSGTTGFVLNEDGDWIQAQKLEDTFIGVNTLDANGRSKKSPSTFNVESKKISEIVYVVTASGAIAGIDTWESLTLNIILFGAKGNATINWGASADRWVQFFDPKLEIVDQSINMNTTEIIYEVSNDASAVAEEKEEYLFGEFPDESQFSATLLSDGSKNAGTWVTHGDSTNRELLELVIRERLAMRSKPEKTFDGSATGYIVRHKAVSIYNEEGTWLPAKWKYDYAKGMALDCRWIKLRKPSESGGLTLKKTVKLSDGTIQPVVGIETPPTLDRAKSNDFINNVTDMINRIKFQKGLVMKKTGTTEDQFLKWESSTTEDITDYINPTASGFEFKTDGFESITFDVSGLTAAANIKIPNVSATATLATDETAWMYGGNTVTSEKSFGTLDDFNIPIIQNGNTVAVFNAKGASFPAIQEGELFEGARDFVFAGIDLAAPTKQLIKITNAQATEYLSNYLWKVGGNTLSSSQVMGSVSGSDFDIPVHRNGVEVGKWRTGGLTVPTLIASNLTANYVPKHTAAGLVDGLIYDNGTNIGIGAGTSPATKLDVRGQISANLGSLSNPAYAFVGDLNTGMYSSGADALALVTGGVNRLHVNSNGSVGIGTTSLTGYNLRVSKNITGATGYASVASDGVIQSDVTASITGFLNTISTQATAFTLANYVHFQAVEGTLGAGSAVTTQTGYRVGSLVNASTIYGFRSTIAASSNRWNNFHDGTAQNHFRGNVGIGANTTVPTTTLDIRGSHVAARGLLTLQSTSGNIAAMTFYADTVYSGAVYGAVDGTLNIFSGSTSTPINIQQSGTSRIYVGSTGNVGIDNTNPAYGLDVTGTGHFTGAVTFDTVPSSLQDATSSNHLVRYSQFIAATYLKPYNQDVKTVSFTSLTKSGLYAINGYTPTTGQYVLDAANDINSGIWVVSSGAWSRATDADTDPELRGFVISISQGTYAGYKYYNTNNSAITVGSTAITYNVWSNVSEIDPIFTAWRDNTRSANTFWAAPNGSNGVATWRGLVAADIPTLNQSTTGSAATLTTARTIALSGDATWSVSFNGSADVTAALTLATISDGGTGTFLKITRNTKGLVTGTQAVAQADITGLLGANSITNTMVNSLDWSKLTSVPTTLSGYGITDAQPTLNGTGYVKMTGTTASYDNRDFVDLTTNQTNIAGIKEFTTSGSSISNIKFEKIGTTPDEWSIQTIQSGTDYFLSLYNVYDDFDAMRLYRSGHVLMDKGVFGGGSVSGFTDALTVNGNIRVSGAIKPDNVAPTVGYFLKGVDADNMSWSALGHADISNLASYTGFDARYYTETESDARFVALAGSYSNPTWITSLDWSKITTGKPTTIAGYGITDYNSLWDARLATKTTSNLTEGSNLYFTNARAIGSTLTGYTSGAGTVASTDTILQAIQKLNGNISAYSGTYVNLTSNVTGILPIANGGTGSATQNFVDLTTAQSISGNKNFYGGLILFSDTEFSQLTISGGGSHLTATGMIGVGSFIFAVPSVISVTGATVYSVNNSSGLLLGGSINGLSSPTERLQVNGNIRYTTLLKPNNIAGTSGQFLGTSGTQDIWTTLTTSHISNLSSYEGFDARYYTETESDLRFVDFDTDQNINGIKTFSNHINIGGFTLGESLYSISGVSRTLAKIWHSSGIVVNGGSRGIHISYDDVVHTSINDTGILIGDVLNKGTFATEKLQVNGNIRYSGVLKPSNTAGTNGQVLSTNGTNDSWTTLTTSHISNISDYLTVATFTEKVPIDLGQVHPYKILGNATPSNAAVQELGATDVIKIISQGSITIGSVLTMGNDGVGHWMNLDIAPQGLSYRKIAVGDSKNYLSELNNFEFIDNYLSISGISNYDKKINIGVNNNDSFINAIGGKLILNGANGLNLSNFSGSGTRYLTVNEYGDVSTSAASGGGSIVSIPANRLAFGASDNSITSSELLKYFTGTKSLVMYDGFGQDSNVYFHNPSANLFGITTNGTTNGFFIRSGTVDIESPAITIGKLGLGATLVALGDTDTDIILNDSTYNFVNTLSNGEYAVFKKVGGKMIPQKIVVDGSNFLKLV